MAVKKSSSRAPAAVAAADDAAEPTKAELQRRMEEAREDISQTVEEIKDTVTGTVESVKETVADALDWREQFRKHSVAWSLGALAVGYVVGSGIAASIKDATAQKGRRSGGLLDNIYAYGEMLADEFTDVAQTVLLPAIGKKIKDSFGVDISGKLAALGAKKISGRSQSQAKRTAKSPAKKTAARKSGGNKGSAKKGAGKKKAATKGGSQ